MQTLLLGINPNKDVCDSPPEGRSRKKLDIVLITLFPKTTNFMITHCDLSSQLKKKLCTKFNSKNTGCHNLIGAR